ncbi:MAG: hypothetical protein P8P53_14435 [Tateyamaria sp.]|nr:hypothetical protein [Tateyamaria sp.]
MKTHEKANKYAGGWDTFVLEGKWREWLLDSGFIPDSVEGSFMAFVKNTLRTTAKHRNRNTGRLTLSQHYIPCVVMRIV